MRNGVDEGGIEKEHIDADAFENLPDSYPVRLRSSLRKFKISFVIILAVAAGLIALLGLFQTHPAQSTVEEAFRLVEKGDIEGVMEYVDPESRLGAMWYENLDGARDKLRSLMDRYRLDFSSLSFATKSEAELAEVELKGGKVNIYEAGEDGPPAAHFDLGGSDLIFFMERKEGQWLIEGTNYDPEVLLSEEGLFSF